MLGSNILAFSFFWVWGRRSRMNTYESFLSMPIWDLEVLLTVNRGELLGAMERDVFSIFNYLAKHIIDQSINN